MKEKKSQAAFEFLVTYGWAIFAVLIVLSGLAYFGFFNTERFINDDCLFGDQLRCEDYILSGGTATMNLTLRNNFGVNIDIMGINVSSDYGNNIVCKVEPNSNILAGRLFNTSCILYPSGNILVSEKVRAKVVVVFSKTGSGNLHNQTGSVTITSQ